MLSITTMVKKCDHLQDYNTQLEGQVTPLQAQIVKLWKKLGSSFKSSTSLKKKHDDQAITFSAIQSKHRLKTLCHSNDVEQFRSIIYKLEEDLSYT